MAQPSIAGVIGSAPVAFGRYLPALIACHNSCCGLSAGWRCVVVEPDFVTRAKAGDRSVLGRMLNEFHDLLRARARESFDVRLRGRISESDLVQMTLMTAAEGFPAFRGQSEGELVAWLKAILAQHMAATARWHIRTQKHAAGKEVTFEGFSPNTGGQSASADGDRPSGQPRADPRRVAI